MYGEVSPSVSPSRPSGNIYHLNFYVGTAPSEILTFKEILFYKTCAPLYQLNVIGAKCEEVGSEGVEEKVKVMCITWGGT